MRNALARLAGRPGVFPRPRHGFRPNLGMFAALGDGRLARNRGHSRPRTSGGLGTTKRQSPAFATLESRLNIRLYTAAGSGRMRLGRREPDRRREYTRHSLSCPPTVPIAAVSHRANPSWACANSPGGHRGHISSGPGQASAGQGPCRSAVPPPTARPASSRPGPPPAGAIGRPGRQPARSAHGSRSARPEPHRGRRQGPAPGGNVGQNGEVFPRTGTPVPGRCLLPCSDDRCQHV